MLTRTDEGGVVSNQRPCLGPMVSRLCDSRYLWWKKIPCGVYGNKRLTVKSSGVLEQGHAICSRELYTIWKNSSWHASGPWLRWSAYQGISSDRVAKLSMISWDLSNLSARKVRLTWEQLSLGRNGTSPLVKSRASRHKNVSGPHVPHHLHTSSSSLPQFMYMMLTCRIG